MRGVYKTALALGALAVAGALGGCGGTTARAVGEAPAPQVTVPKTSLVTANLSTADIYGNQAAAATVPIRPEQQASAPAVTAPPGIDSPRRLVGLDRPALQTLLGNPALRRIEGKAELWQYRAASCVLDVFLYPGKDGAARVTHADLRGRRDSRQAPQGCYGDIVAAGDKRSQTARN